MLLWGLTETEVRATIARVSADKYGGNLRPGVGGYAVRQEGPRVRFTIGVESSRGPGARRAASGRRLAAASWQAHYDVMAALFDAGATRIASGMADYRGGDGKPALIRSEGWDGRRYMRKAGVYESGRRAFDVLAERTADLNVGSVVNPVAFGEL